MTNRNKNRFGRFAIAYVAAFAVSMAFAGHGFAQEAAAAKKKGAKDDAVAWVKLCDKAPHVDPKTKEKTMKNVCLVHHERLDVRTGRVLVQAAVRSVEGSDKKRLIILVPLGMALPVGLHLKIDKNKPTKLKYLMCHSGGCVAEGEATPELLDQLKKGERLIVAGYSLAAKPIAFPVSLTGFGAAMKGKPVDGKKYAEARKQLMKNLYDKRKELLKKEREAQGQIAKEEAQKQIDKAKAEEE